MLSGLEAAHPKLVGWVIDERGCVRPHVNVFLKDMLDSVSPSVALGQDTTLLRGILDKTDQRVGTELTNQPQVELELRNILSGIYLDLSLYKEAHDTLQAGLSLAVTMQLD